MSDCDTWVNLGQNGLPGPKGQPGDNGFAFVFSSRSVNDLLS